MEHEDDLSPLQSALDKADRRLQDAIYQRESLETEVCCCFCITASCGTPLRWMDGSGQCGCSLQRGSIATPRSQPASRLTHLLCQLCHGEQYQRTEPVSTSTMQTGVSSAMGTKHAPDVRTQPTDLALFSSSRESVWRWGT